MAGWTNDAFYVKVGQMEGRTNVGRTNFCRTKLAAPVRSANPGEFRGIMLQKEREECISNLRTVCVCLRSRRRSKCKKLFCEFCKMLEYTGYVNEK